METGPHDPANFATGGEVVAASNRWWESFREEMPVAGRWVYLDHAAVGPIPRSGAEAVKRFADQAAEDGDFHWPKWSAAAQGARQAAAAMLHASPEEIALVANTTLGIHTIALAYPWKPHDSVVILENEFPSNQLPWLVLRDRGVEVRVVQANPDGSLCIDRILDAMDHSTRLVALSWIGYATGYRISLPQVCDRIQKRGAEIFLDAIQGLGVFPINLSDIPIDYLAADGHKWLLGPEGAGIAFMRQKHLDKLQPALAGWNSLQASHEFVVDNKPFKTTAARYEGGSSNHVGFAALQQSMELLLQFGCHREGSGFAQRVLDLVAHAEEGLLAHGAKIPWHSPKNRRDLQSHASGILSFDLPGKDPHAVRKNLMDSGVILSVRHGSLRIAVHAYNTLEDIQRLLDAIAWVNLN
jgi:selenocysteine lyase/cysteine desulfurase